MRLVGMEVRRAALALSLFGLLAAPAVAGEPDFCRRTTANARRSCEAGAQSDFWLALGKCNNLSSAAGRRSCENDARRDLADARKTCGEQQDARQEVCARLGNDPYDPPVDPDAFTSTIDNPYLPLTPGKKFVYEGQTPDGLEHDEVLVTHKTRVILGVTCVEVRDTVRVDGAVTEDTLDWFAQDLEGNVWYFGENAKQLESGRVIGVEGSWVGGEDGAKPGLAMKAHPAVGDFYRQEFLLGTAEDVGLVSSVNETVTVPYGSFRHCVKTDDTTPLEPDTLEQKFYAPNVGLVLEVDPNTGERLKLLRVTTV